MFTGMGSLSYGEMAGQRMKLGLLLHDPEEEHDCFSDNTHISHLYDAIGIQDVYLGRYKKLDGTMIEGASLASLVAAKDAAVDAEVQANLATTVAAMQVIANRAETVEAYDQMIGEGNAEGNAIIQTAINGLVAQTKSFERAITVLGLSGVTIEGSDSLDKPEAVFQ
jgi:putative iron-regulated protein